MQEASTAPPTWTASTPITRWTGRGLRPARWCMAGQLTRCPRSRQRRCIISCLMFVHELRDRLLVGCQGPSPQLPTILVKAVLLWWLVTDARLICYLVFPRCRGGAAQYYHQHTTDGATLPPCCHPTHTLIFATDRHQLVVRGQKLNREDVHKQLKFLNTDAFTLPLIAWMYWVFMTDNKLQHRAVDI